MSPIKEKLYLLLEKAEWSTEDEGWLLDFLESGDTALLRELLNEKFIQDLVSKENGSNERARQILEQIHQKIRIDEIERPVKSISYFPHIAVAATVLLLFVSSFFIFQNRNDSNKLLPPVAVVKKQSVKDLMPGKDKAVLTLADGSIVILDEASQGNIATQPSAAIHKVDDGSLLYEANAPATQIVYNSISTPRGGKFHITLSDGTKVWLNAASSLRFPVGFSRSERRVELTGEGYFEVAKNPSQPFIVDVAGKEEVRVLGTHFNINSYSDESSINTTLLEGLVSIQAKGAENVKTLIPGQQHRFYETGKTRMLNNVDTEEAIAWKNDKFDFGESMELKAVMRQIERWYNVEVEYQGDVSTIELGGSISRNVSASKVFQMLELTGVASFKIDNGKVIVSGRKK